MINSLFRKTLLIITLIIAFAGLSHAGAETFPEVMFILDASGSMWGAAEGQTKIEAARNVLAKVVPALPEEVKVGLTVYGHNRKGDCTDIEILVPSGSDDRAGLLAQVQKISPKGKTPIADSIKMVAEGLKTREGETTVVLVSDGEETCHDDPCGVVKALKASGIKFILHVVGFDVSGKAGEQLACLAEAGGGEYFAAQNADALLTALEAVKKEVAQKVEKAKATKKTATTKLGKLQIKIPAGSTVSLNTFKIIRKSDGKVVKTVKDPGPDATHTLIAGEYELIAGFANSNNRPDSDISFGVWEVKGGETNTLNLGAMVINIADSLANIPAGAVIITKPDDPEFVVTIPYTGNSYYFYKTKPLPAGAYNFAVHYKGSYLYRTSEKPVVLVAGISVAEGRESVVTIDSGIILKKPQDSSVIAWELIPAEKEETLIRIERASNGDYPLWKTYAVPAGTYSLKMYIEGMDEPLPVGEGISISKGELLEFDTGL